MSRLCWHYGIVHFFFAFLVEVYRFSFWNPVANKFLIWSLKQRYSAIWHRQISSPPFEEMFLFSDEAGKGSHSQHGTSAHSIYAISCGILLSIHLHCLISCSDPTTSAFSGKKKSWTWPFLGDLYFLRILDPGHGSGRSFFGVSCGDRKLGLWDSSTVTAQPSWLQKKHQSHNDHPIIPILQCVGWKLLNSQIGL